MLKVEGRVYIQRGVEAELDSFIYKGQPRLETIVLYCIVFLRDLNWENIQPKLSCSIQAIKVLFDNSPKMSKALSLFNLVDQILLLTPGKAAIL